MIESYDASKEISAYTSEESYKFYKCFCKNEQTEGSYHLFPKLSNLYVLCATIGYFLGERTKIVNPVRCTRSISIGQQDELPTLISIAYADPIEGRDNILFMDIKKVFNICDEYAETGVRFLAEQYPFKSIYSKGAVYNYEKIDLEFNVMLLIKELKNKFSESLI